MKSTAVLVWLSHLFLIVVLSNSYVQTFATAGASSYLGANLSSEVSYSGHNCSLVRWLSLLLFFKADYLAAGFLVATVAFFFLDIFLPG